MLRHELGGQQGIHLVAHQVLERRREGTLELLCQGSRLATFWAPFWGLGRRRRTESPPEARLPEQILGKPIAGASEVS